MTKGYNSMFALATLLELGSYQLIPEENLLKVCW